ncbi:hypothetical protein KFL_008230010 [Klebsormidium nitens]|uniref:Glycosyltransferase family 92 protein n=1 Tax=Klebsormidium nitens TaxID=105231 RepID=A0A1Y1IL74_KLENI|nr:hypothetical protein KFL_008230010 [Klebsormidium nitens]|eukprot:GAQ91635.1 hypothetical protein KFL_008230010 [Klebsormidium nitens]
MAAESGGKIPAPGYSLWDRSMRLRLEGALCVFLCLALAGGLWSIMTFSYGQDGILSGFHTGGAPFEVGGDNAFFRRFAKASEPEEDSHTQAEDTWFEDIKFISERTGPKAIIKAAAATAVDSKTNVSLISAFLDKGVVNPDSRVSRIIVNAAVQSGQRYPQNWECLICRSGPLEKDGRWGPDFIWGSVAPLLKPGVLDPPRRKVFQDRDGFGIEEGDLDEEDEDASPQQMGGQAGGGGGEFVLNCWKSKGVEMHVDWGDMSGKPSLAMQWHCLLAEGDDGFDLQLAAVVRPGDKESIERVLFPEGRRDLRRFVAVDQAQGRVVPRVANIVRRALLSEGGKESEGFLKGEVLNEAVSEGVAKVAKSRGRSLLESGKNAASWQNSHLQNCFGEEQSRKRKGAHFGGVDAEVFWWGDGEKKRRALLQAEEKVSTRWVRKWEAEGRRAIANITVCTGPLYGDHHEMLAEWVAFNLLMGANKVRVYYVAKGVSPKVIPVLEYFARGGQLEYFEWHPPQVAAFNNGQNMFYHDCYYRSAADSDYVLFTDVDEFLAPSHVVYDTWHDALDPYFKTPKIGALHFQSWFYHLQCPVHGPSIRSELVTASVPGRRSEPVPKSERTKYMVQVGAARWLGLHSLDEDSGLNPGFLRKDVSTGLMHVRHYSDDMHTEDCSPTTIKKSKKDRGMDHSMLRFQDKLYARVRAALAFADRMFEADQRT